MVGQAWPGAPRGGWSRAALLLERPNGCRAGRTQGDHGTCSASPGCGSQRVSHVILPLLVVGGGCGRSGGPPGSAERPAVLKERTPHLPLTALSWVRTPKLLSRPIQAAARASWRSQEHRNVCAICPQPGVALWHHSKDLTPPVAAAPKQEAAGRGGPGREATGGSHSSVVSLSRCLGAGQGLAPLLCPPILVWSSAGATPATGCFSERLLCTWRAQRRCMRRWGPAFSPAGKSTAHRCHLPPCCLKCGTAGFCLDT